MIIIAILLLFFGGRMMNSNSASGEDVLLSALSAIAGAVLILGATIIFHTEIQMDTKEEVLQHLNLTKDVKVTLDSRNEFQYELEDSTYNDLFEYLTKEKKNKE